MYRLFHLKKPVRTQHFSRKSLIKRIPYSLQILMGYRDILLFGGFLHESVLPAALPKKKIRKLLNILVFTFYLVVCIPY